MKPVSSRVFVDQYEHRFRIGKEISRGGQGVVYETPEADYAVKIVDPRTSGGGDSDPATAIERNIERIRLLPIPDGLPLASPVTFLREPSKGGFGYAMRFVSGTVSFLEHFYKGVADVEINAAFRHSLPETLSDEERKKRLRFLSRYAEQGNARVRTLALADLACTLARLHSAGVVYRDLSPANVLFRRPKNNLPLRSYLIDPDNLCLTGDVSEKKQPIYTPGYGAPEKLDQSNPPLPRWTEDAWSFAVLAYRVLTSGRPFPENEADGDDWDRPQDAASPSFSYSPADGIPLIRLVQPNVRSLFQKTLGEGAAQPNRRVPLLLWAFGLAKSADLMVECPNCHMAFFPDNETECPWCKGPRPRCVEVMTPRWTLFLSERSKGPKEVLFDLPSRLFKPFSPVSWNATEFRVRCSFDDQTLIPTRKTDLPSETALRWMTERPPHEV